LRCWKQNEPAFAASEEARHDRGTRQNRGAQRSHCVSHPYDQAITDRGGGASAEYRVVEPNAAKGGGSMNKPGGCMWAVLRFLRTAAALEVVIVWIVSGALWVAVVPLA
jgi:hypothetical protein